MSHMPGTELTRSQAWAEVRAVASDPRSGAAQLARRAAAALSVLEEGELLDALGVLLAGHPSMAPLWRLGTVLLGSADHPGAGRRFVEELDREKDAAVAVAAAAIGRRVVTISWTSMVIGALVRRAAAGPPEELEVLCSRSEPEGEGAMTADALREHGIDAQVVSDAEALERVPGMDAVVTGADAVTPGGVVNKAGTRALAAAARRAGIPWIVVAGQSKLVGAEVPVVAPFERTPIGLVGGVVAGGQLLPAQQASAQAAARRLDPRLVALMETIASGRG
jgi:initiation factor 2B subunit 1/2 family protein